MYSKFRSIMTAGTWNSIYLAVIFRICGNFSIVHAIKLSSHCVILRYWMYMSNFSSCVPRKHEIMIYIPSALKVTNRRSKSKTFFVLNLFPFIIVKDWHRTEGRTDRQKSRGQWRIFLRKMSLKQDKIICFLISNDKNTLFVASKSSI